MIDEKKLVYVGGHNTIVYNTDDPTSMQFVPGSENTEHINFIALSPNTPCRYLAVCERGREGECKAKVTIYDQLRKKRIIPDLDAEVDHDINAMEFLGAAFSPSSEKEHLVTLSGAPDWELILWKWDTFKLLARYKLNVPAVELDPLSFSISI